MLFPSLERIITHLGGSIRHYWWYNIIHIILFGEFSCKNNTYIQYRQFLLVVLVQHWDNTTWTISLCRFVCFFVARSNTITIWEYIWERIYLILVKMVIFEYYKDTINIDVLLVENSDIHWSKWWCSMVEVE